MFSLNRSARRSSANNAQFVNPSQRESAHAILDSVLAHHPMSPVVIETAGGMSFRIDTNGHWCQLGELPFYETEDWHM